MGGVRSLQTGLSNILALLLRSCGSGASPCTPGASGSESVRWDSNLSSVRGGCEGRVSQNVLGMAYGRGQALLGRWQWSAATRAPRAGPVTCHHRCPLLPPVPTCSSHVKGEASPGPAYLCLCPQPSVLTRFSHVQLPVTPWTVARQAPLCVGFSRPEYWSGLPWPPPLPSPGIKPASLALAGGFFTIAPPGKPHMWLIFP